MSAPTEAKFDVSLLAVVRIEAAVHFMITQALLVLAATTRGLERRNLLYSERWLGRYSPWWAGYQHRNGRHLGRR